MMWKEKKTLQNKNISKYVGEQIRKFRLLKGLTQKELGLKVGVKHNTISSYESGTNEPEQNILFALAKALDISIDDFFPPINAYSMVAESKANYSTGGFIMLPIVGRISCGNGALAYEEIEGYEPTPKEWLNGEEYFYLRAKGDSMIGARIHDGDLLLIRKQPEVENGEIAVVLIEDEATLKRVFKSNQHLVLQSENPNYPPILAPPTNVKIIGKLKKIVINV